MTSTKFSFQPDFIIRIDPIDIKKIVTNSHKILPILNKILVNRYSTIIYQNINIYIEILNL